MTEAQGGHGARCAFVHPTDLSGRRPRLRRGLRLHRRFAGRLDQRAQPSPATPETNSGVFTVRVLPEVRPRATTGRGLPNRIIYTFAIEMPEKVVLRRRTMPYSTQQNINIFL